MKPLTKFTKTITPAHLNNTISAGCTREGAADIPDLIRNVDHLTHAPQLKSDIYDPKVSTTTAYAAQNSAVDPKHPVYHMLGPRTFGAVTTHGLLVGASNHPLVYAILYMDNRDRLRFYTPTLGNAINPITGWPFGQEQVADDIIAQHIGYASYADIDTNDAATLVQFFDTHMLTQDITTTIIHI